MVYGKPWFMREGYETYVLEKEGEWLLGDWLSGCLRFHSRYQRYQAHSDHLQSEWLERFPLSATLIGPWDHGNVVCLTCTFARRH